MTVALWEQIKRHYLRFYYWHYLKQNNCFEKHKILEKTKIYKCFCVRISTKIFIFFEKKCVIIMYYCAKFEVSYSRMSFFLSFMAQIRVSWKYYIVQQAPFPTSLSRRGVLSILCRVHQQHERNSFRSWINFRDSKGCHEMLYVSKIQNKIKIHVIFINSGLS